MLKKLSRKHYLFIVGVILVLFIGALVYHFAEGENEGDGDNNSNVTGTALVSVTTAQTASFSPTISAYGTLAVNPSQAQTMSLQGTGVIQSIQVMPYTKVKKSQKLIEIGPTPDIAATLENAQANLKRQQDLRKEYLATNADVQAAQATLTSLQAQYGNGTKWITAPSDGVVGAILVQPGQVVSGGSALLSFSKTLNIGATLGITTSEQASIKEGNVVVLHVVDNPTLQFNGKVIGVASQLNDQTGLIDVQVKLDSQSKLEDLIVNTPVQAEIATQALEPRILLPRSAVLYQGNQAYVFIDQNNKAVYRIVTVAGETSQDVAIASGINPGEVVVTSGNYELQDGMPLAIQGSNS